MPGTELIAPSILSADFARLGEEVERVLAAGADLIHFDVMDNHYVPNLTIGPLVCAALRKHGITAPIDVHLMVKPVDRIIPDFGARRARPTSRSIPRPASMSIAPSELIRESGAKPGLVFNPATPLDWLDHTLEKIDMVLLMSVNPGFAGQKFITSVLPKLEQVRSRIDASGRGVRLEIDGGVKVDNIGAIARAGADTFVAGSAIFESPDYAATIREMRAEIAKGRRNALTSGCVPGTVSAYFSSSSSSSSSQSSSSSSSSSSFTAAVLSCIIGLVGTITGRVFTLGRAL